jgi:hypothetical protein
VDRMAAMEAFIRVVDAGSFSGAAKQCVSASQRFPKRSRNSKSDSACDSYCVRRTG